MAREERTRAVFQEMNYTSVFGSFTKGVYEISEGLRARELLARGFLQAQTGTPGPVVFSLPEDMLNDEAGDDAPLVYPLPTLGHSASAVERIQQVIDSAARPIVLAGAALRSDAGKAALQRFAEAQRIPVATTWKNQDVFDNGSSLYAGHIGFGSPQAYKDVLAEADVILAFGTRLGDVATLHHSFPAAPEPSQTVVQVYPDAAPLGRVARVDLPIVADPAAVLADLATSARVVNASREAWVSKVNGFVRDFQSFTPRNPTDGVDFGEVVMASRSWHPPTAPSPQIPATRRHGCTVIG